MKHPVTRCKRHRFPPQIIQYAVWLYHRFNLSHRDIEDLLARRGILATHESIRLCCNKFGPVYARRLRRRHRGYGDTFFLDEVFVRIRGEQRCLWRAVDQTDKLGSYAVARRELIPETMHDTSRHANNRVELSLQPTRVRERGMRRFKSMLQAQRFLRVHAAVSNLFNLGRHLVAADRYRTLRQEDFASWDSVVAI